ncbi:membrane protein insertase YidC [Methylocystis sp. MJC1]|jgi:YidC/Oxa1 family membrane protein insertase|uniref:membrane protein insertase YidC n=1 Tax=Methylocystis sp. MJC1 TaxID=2654282 RepID=UPI0013EA1DE5|nr:membrane protein insertase YidC [Methylocystis sp. MJC1]KAF2990327.1 Membrane protein insertase YidC [Methylocystis sp. MJC1]MBU6528126.1 membrane protein insertase YidC [Methylocystis sp. MJC1]UZX11038.1 membrane protein insertase YidC [Methylocystis sp. MJC1]
MTENTKNMLVAAALSMIFIGLWDYFYAFPEMERQRQAQVEQQRMAKIPKLGAPDKAGAAAPIKLARTRDEALAESPRIAVDTRTISGSIALKGGRIDDVSLKNYRQTVDPTSPIITLLSPENAPGAYYAELGYLTGETENAPALPTTETVWTADTDKLTSAKPVTLTWDNGQGLVFKRVISVDDEYLFTIKDSVENKSAKPAPLYTFSRVIRVGRPPSAGYAALHEGYVGVIGDQAEELNYDKIEKEPNYTKTFKGVGGWVGFTDKYWGAVVAPDQNTAFEARYMAMGGANKTYQADTVSEPKTIEPGASAETTTYVFAGAKEIDTLDAYKANPGLKRFDLLIDWGWFYFITRPMFRLIDFLYKLFGNFGVAILAVTVIVKLAFLPLANKSYQSIAKMKEIQPKIKELKEKFGDDKHAFNMAQMELYKREKVNPASGCLPVLLQIPVFFSLYKVLVVTIEMRHAPFFGWIRDLSAPDPTNIFNLFGLLPFDPTHIAFFGPYLALGVWPLVMGVTMWLQMKMNPEPTDEIQKTMFAWMPVMFTFTMGGFASGLVIYWSWNNLLSITQQGVIMKRAGVKFELWDNLRKTFGQA